MPSALFLMTLLATACSGDQPPEGTPADAIKIQGTWKVVSMIEAGREVVPPLPFDQLVFSADSLTMRPPQGPGLTLSYSLDPARRPKAIDTSHELDRGKPIVQLGVYELDGDTLALCFEAAGKPRPASLESKDGDTRHVFRLKRITSRKKEEQP